MIKKYKTDLDSKKEGAQNGRYILSYSIADRLTYEVFGIVPDTRLAESVNFVIYDAMKIFVLLGVMIFFISYMRTYITPERTRKLLGNNYDVSHHVKINFGDSERSSKPQASSAYPCRKLGKSPLPWLSLHGSSCV